MTPDDNKDKIIDLTSEVKSLVTNKTRIKKNLTPDKFMAIVSNEMGCIRKCNAIIKKIEKYLCSDEFIFALEPKDLILLLNSVVKSKYASLGFLTKLYDISTKNEMLRAYFQDLPSQKMGNMPQDARVREFVNEMKRRARENNDLPPEN